MKIISNGNYSNGLNNTYSVTSTQARHSPPISFTAPKPSLSLLEEPVFFAGYVEGFRQPVIRFILKMRSTSREQRYCLQQALEHYFSQYSVERHSLKSMEALIACFGESIRLIQQLGGLPIFETAQYQAIANTEHEFILCVPTLFVECIHPIHDFVLKLFNHHLSQNPFMPEPEISAQLNNLISSIETYAPKGYNRLRFLHTAHKEGISWMHLSKYIYQFGYGINSRWLDSTITDNTRSISVCLARDKQSTSMLLSKAGFPVPEQTIIDSEAEAVFLANKIGYPVVLKPLDEAGGRGVFAGLTSDDKVKKAYHAALKYSNVVLLEKHITGKDYRLTVLNGQLVWAIERVPAGITGNGVNTIYELVQEVNLQPERGVSEQSPLKHIEITKEVTEFLSEQNFSLTSIPELDQFVPLTSTANISTGGTPIGVFDKVHPDNKRLAEAAANLLRLDLAGIDLILPDIQQSYLESAGKIIEINAQPQLVEVTTAPHIYKDILLSLVLNQGHIPIIVACGNCSDSASFIQNLQNILPNYYKNIGVAKETNTYINNQHINCAPSLFEAGRALLLNKTIDVLVYCIQQGDDVGHHGLPFDRYDILFLFDESILNKKNKNPYGIDITNTLFKACHDSNIILEAASEGLEKLTQWLKASP